jgi:hypothetical protein
VSEKYGTGEAGYVFRLIPKLDVAGSNPVGRSINSTRGYGTSARNLSEFLLPQLELRRRLVECRAVVAGQVADETVIVLKPSCETGSLQVLLRNDRDASDEGPIARASRQRSTYERAPHGLRPKDALKAMPKVRVRCHAAQLAARRRAHHGHSRSPDPERRLHGLDRRRR